VRADVRAPLVLLFTTTGIVLLIACANIANLLSARATSRAPEITVRVALGASRWHLVQQLLAESCVLAVCGGVASLFLGRWVLASAVALMPSDMALLFDPQLHIPALLFTAELATGTGLIFGLLPALHATRPDIASAIRAGSAKQAGARFATRARASLVTAQIALSMALLIVAGLFLESFVNVTRVNLGMDIRHVATFGISPERIGYTSARSRVLFADLQEKLAALPGVTGVATSEVPLLSGDNIESAMSVEGFTPGPDGNLGARLNEVSPGYFSVMGIPFVAGRALVAGDGVGSKVAVVNEAFARKFQLGRDAVGKHLSASDTSLDVEIVGVVKDAKYSEVKDRVPPQYFIPTRQDTALGAMTFYVRTIADPQQLERPITGVVKQLDPNLPVENLRTLSQQAADNVSTDRLISILSIAFAALATLLAAVGLYGVLAYSISSRTKEIGIRMALGADRRRVLRMILGQVGVMTFIGAVIGIAAALVLGNAARSLLFEIQSDDPTVVAGAAILLTIVALGAAYRPARQASKNDPMDALRHE